MRAQAQYDRVDVAGTPESFLGDGEDLSTEDFRAVDKLLRSRGLHKIADEYAMSLLLSSACVSVKTFTVSLRLIQITPSNSCAGSPG